MKKVVILFCLSLLIGMVNAASMPFQIAHTSLAATDIAGHDHCETAVNADQYEGGASSYGTATGHYCCSTIAVLNTPFIFSHPEQSHAYSFGYGSKLISNIAESIYKPPKNQA
ncbi:hypothetical protein [Polynucleobacter sp. AP-Nino-20-G2]|uniref:hypothetical protein n=1 Tax=Polynucleobacter sp. AP-Nino-20-G2 TaxID=2576917 RepID=UPI001BFE4AD2|nr:hypothetical protein [Polynucleobacter sp. AP-Nino-20-G2]QWE16005.1 hypothetical protein FD960_06820 [Polynucleobacter sp. AP-Nino-20-G2]